MTTLKASIAGSLESNDCLVSIYPDEDGLSIAIESIVKEQFGALIELAIREELSLYEVENIRVLIKDKGALDCVIRARVAAALLRAGAKQTSKDTNNA
ncbi:citrate lyase acyl carrier protein [Rhodobacteraceae bacterium RKSG542]|uniref:citrate lyase acyl carrier protein n=1 Tax=Pseudovibrio flavus TaxID=2529854 RepID=UPI0012BBAA67|nr:citrate lyase acyl carrier protein [Pseudovibrio flavus]MTI15935.1 citrate lyase acyl carrier protein [Pseudovibrio flavus]